MNWHPGCELGLCLEATPVGNVRVVLEAGEERGGQRGDQHGAGQRGADRRAELGAGVLEPADLAALLVGHRGDGHAPSCEAIAPSPAPASSSGQVMISGPGADVQQRDQQHEAGEQEHESEPDDAPRRHVREQLRDPDGEQRAATARAAAAGRRSRSPTGRARPTGTAGRVKKIPAWTRNMNRNDMTPLRSWRLRSIDGSTSDALAPLDPPVLPDHEQRQHDAAREDHPDHGGEPEPLGGARAWAARSPRCRT